MRKYKLISPPPTEKELALFKEYQKEWTNKRPNTHYGLLETRPNLYNFIYNLRLKK